MQCASVMDFKECYTPERWEFQNITRPFSILYYVLGGSAYYKIEGEEHRFQKGHLYIMPANRVFSLRELPDDKFYSLYLHVFTFPEINTLIEIDTAQDRFLFDTLEMIRRYIRQPDKIYVYKLTEMLISYISEKEEQTGVPLHRRMKKYIDDHFVEAFHGHAFSVQFNYSDSHLVKIFKGEYNITPKEYARQLVTREIILLLRKEMSIAEIASRLQFSSPENLCRFFKKQYGISPTEYRKKFKDFPF
ncbi:MAG: helix-turn-helix transcriptional regulator [Ruminococcaceae bacterium]|nr:helix-turn-helix transcriptional regulator [Oscillospiraceae bacterium]